jgi:hypothetical protein
MKVNGKTIKIDGVNFDLLPLQEVVFKLFLTNPKWVVSPEGFRVIAYRYQTSMAYAWRASLTGTEMKPGNLSSATVTPVLSVAKIAKSKTLDYDLSFQTTNSVPSEGVIRVDLPTEFQIVKDTPYDYVAIMAGV